MAGGVVMDSHCPEKIFHGKCFYWLGENKPAPKLPQGLAVLKGFGAPLGGYPMKEREMTKSICEVLRGKQAIGCISRPLLSDHLHNKQDDDSDCSACKWEGKDG